MARAHSVVVLN